ncbi:MAG: DUF3048 domain-containing protein, partial [Acidimicrobiales bacterium]
MARRDTQPTGYRTVDKVVAAVAVAVVAVGTVDSLLVSRRGHHQAAAVATTVGTLVPAPTPPTTSISPTTVAPPALSPLTGLPQPNAAQLTRPAVVVKIDNVDAARPQTGLNQADVIYEEMVEGGLTRLAAVFQSDYPNPVGPVRSGRLTDSAIADDLNHPVLAYAGTNAMFLPILRSQPLTDVDTGNHPGAFFRTNLAAVPHNLYAAVTGLAALDTPAAPPGPLFSFRRPGAPFTASGVGPAAGMTVAFPAASVAWTFDPVHADWSRNQNGTPDVDRAGQALTAANVVVQAVTYINSGTATGEGAAPAPIPEGVLVGSGPVWVISTGGVVKGTWSRPNLTSTTSYVDGTGSPIQLAPGRTWV